MQTIPMTTFHRQFIPLLLAISTFFALTIFLFIFIHFLNLFPTQDKIVPRIFWEDIVVGLTIYLKTSVDFAIVIGNLMSKNSGVKSRIAIEIGTALGNALGTAIVLLIWTFFKEVPLLMTIMIVLASFVLLQMAEDGLNELQETNSGFAVGLLYQIIHAINRPLSPLLHILIPHAHTTSKKQTAFFSLLLFAITVPLILGLDDFAGYIPLFTVINIFGFSVGVFLGHMLLNIALFASPTTTIVLVKKPIISFLGSIAFIGIALWGFVEVFILIKNFV